MLPQEAVSKGRSTEGYCKAGGFPRRSFITDAILGKSYQVLVIYLTKCREKSSWIFSIFSFVHKF